VSGGSFRFRCTQPCTAGKPPVKPSCCEAPAAAWCSAPPAVSPQAPVRAVASSHDTSAEPTPCRRFAPVAREQAACGRALLPRIFHDRKPARRGNIAAARPVGGCVRKSPSRLCSAPPDHPTRVRGNPGQHAIFLHPRTQASRMSVLSDPVQFRAAPGPSLSKAATSTSCVPCTRVDPAGEWLLRSSPGRQRVARVLRRWPNAAVPTR